MFASWPAISCGATVKGEMTGTSKIRAFAVSALSCLAIVLLSLGAHWRALDAGFHLDDFYRATDNPGIESVSPISRHFKDPGTMATLPHLVQYRPLLPLTLSLTHALAEQVETEPVVMHHAGNLSLHILAALLVFFLTRSLQRAALFDDEEPPSAFLPFAAAALFAVHPVAGIAVNYVSNRDLLLALVFIQGALLCYVSATRSGKKRAWFSSALLLVCALLSKQNAALFPAIVFVYELTIGRRGLLDWTLWRRTISFTALVAGFLALVNYGVGFSDADQLLIERAPYEYPLTELRLHLFHYARNIVWPLALHPLPAIEPVKSALEPGVLLGTAFIITSLSIASLLSRARPLVAFSVFAYFGWLSMTSSILPMRSFAEDYRQLISLPFACVLLGVLFSTLPKRGRALALFTACLSLGAASDINARHWQTEESLWGRSVALGTTSIGHLNYGRSVQWRDPALAKLHYERSLELNPNNVYAKINLALQMIHLGMPEEGVALAEETATEVPSWALTQHWLSRAYSLAGRPEEAIAPAVRANEIEPGSSYYREELALLLHGHARELQQSGETPASLPLLELLHSKVERFQDSQFQHAWALHDSGKLDEAVLWYQKHLSADPTNKHARCNLAYALRDLDRKEDAADELRKVLAMDPSYDDARNLLQSLDG